MKEKGYFLKRKANLSINAFLLLIMLVSLIAASTSIYVANFEFYKEEESLIKMDSQSKLLTKLVQINAYYELDKILNDKLSSDDFLKKTSDINGDFIGAIINQKNFSDEHVRYSLARSKDHAYKVIVNKNYVDIYLNSIYKNGDRKRNRDFILRIINPYERPDKSRFIVDRDVKALVKILEV